MAAEVVAMAAVPMPEVEADPECIRDPAVVAEGLPNAVECREDPNQGVVLPRQGRDPLSEDRSAPTEGVSQPVSV